ncbi:hypothetical protein TRM7557_01772 [Tritonibacter multivorans]|uniref:Uncharacterized protein n=1 Tax=Tritonibacter multivorans TaxID=928856 RepID=A0A0P1G9U0_9RHOB|nr:hypothetical protein TRM7557_01772 [Tritonibacter multivorans]
MLEPLTALVPIAMNIHQTMMLTTQAIHMKALVAIR